MEEEYRILVVDDLKNIHDDFKKILAPQKNRAEEGLEKLNQEMFGRPKDDIQLPKFSIDTAFQGEEAIKLVKASIEEGKPYAVAFVDVLMPPGIDGIETIFCLWSIDPGIQVVICTAYSIYTWDEIIRRLGENDQLYIIKKPFDKIEIINLACNLSKRWNISKIIKTQLSLLENAVSSSEQISKEKLSQSLEKLNTAMGILKKVDIHLKDATVREKI